MDCGGYLSAKSKEAAEEHSEQMKQQGWTRGLGSVKKYEPKL
jgi:hypothetical protein